jgi:hypothetical protein
MEEIYMEHIGTPGSYGLENYGIKNAGKEMKAYFLLMVL